MRVGAGGRGSGGRGSGGSGNGGWPAQRVKDGALSYLYTMTPEMFDHVCGTPAFARYNCFANVAPSRLVIYFSEVKPHFRAPPHSFHVYARTHSLAGSPEASSSLLFGGFFFRSADWASKLGIEILKFERFRENRNVSPGSIRGSMLDAQP